ncbi:MAG: sensor domain-containing diguanylate cyclase [Clostridia bacterium]|nr:sensor domain-containing diguanylate cyclase [Clostridia bacterium]
MQTTQKKEERWAHRRRFWACFAVVCLLLSFLAAIYVNSLVEDNRNHRAYLLASKANDISDKLDMLIARVHVMEFMMMADDGEPEDFDVLAPLVLAGWDDSTREMVRNVALAPDGVVQYVYPLEGNEPLIGYNLWEAAAPSAEAVETLRKGRVHITPPIDLVQGGRGMNISLPVNIPGQDESWGIAAIVVDTDKLIASFSLRDFIVHQVEYSLDYENLHGEYENLVTSGEVKFPVYYEFKTENMQWRLAVSGTLGAASNFTIALLVMGVIAVSALLAANFANRHQRKRMSEMFRELANTDSVTGCSTRHFVYEKLVDQESGQWQLDGLNYSLAILDVDHFKNVNDTYGHDVGDEVLQKIAALLMRSLAKNKGDCAIRFGGDEFVLLYGDRTPEQMKDILQHVLTAVRGIQVDDRPDICVSVSIGGVHPSQMVDREATYKNMLCAADDKLYQAKNAGRNRCVM